MKATCCITTVVNEEYAPFAPMFKYCAQKAYPDATVFVFHVGKDTTHWFDGIIDWPENAMSKYVPASLRFLVGDSVLGDFDFCLMTDVDILINRENPNLFDQHLAHMKANGLTCYDNCDHGDHMPGVHFVTRAWWEKTAKARTKWTNRLKETVPGVGEDEQILREVVRDSKLPVANGIITWAVHGIHLGRFRNKSINAVRFQPNEFEFVHSLLSDSVFMELVHKACSESTLVQQVWNSVMALYNKRKG